MKIPDRNHDGYDYESDPNYEFCFHCNKCVMTHDNQIHREGLFYCFSKRKWMAGDDIIQKNCKGFELKTCGNCRWRNTELCRQDAEQGIACLYCNRWKPLYLPHPEIFLMGRTYRQKNENMYVLYAEMKFSEILQKRIDDMENPPPPRTVIPRPRRTPDKKDIPLIAHLMNAGTGEYGYIELPSLKFTEIELGIREGRIPRYIAQQKDFSYVDEETGELWRGKLDIQDKENYTVEEYHTAGGKHEGRTKYRIARTEGSNGKKAGSTEVEKH